MTDFPDSCQKNMANYQPLNSNICQNKWCFIDNPPVGTGPGISANIYSQGITAGSGTTPLRAGIKGDGKLVCPSGVLYNNLNSTTNIHNTNYMNNPVWKEGFQNQYTKDEMKSHMNSKEDIFNFSKSGTPQRQWPTSDFLNKFIQNDDNLFQLGASDTTPDQNEGNVASVPTYTQGNSKYNVLNKYLPGDNLGEYINKLSNQYTKQQTNKPAETFTDTTTETTQTTDPTTDTTTNQTSTDTTTVTTDPNQTDTTQTTQTTDPTQTTQTYQPTPEQQEKWQNQQALWAQRREQWKQSIQQHQQQMQQPQQNQYQGKVKRNNNQIMIDNERSPVNINISCNQGGSHDDHGCNRGFGTPNIYQRCTNKNFCQNSCNGRTLDFWYNDQYDSNIVPRMRRSWQHLDRQFSGHPSNYVTTVSNTCTGNQNIIGAPYAKYTPYYNNNSTPYVDKAKDIFNQLSEQS